MLIDVYGLLPWSRTAAYQPRTNSCSRTTLSLGRQLLIFSSLILVFPVMVRSIEPVPAARWSLSVDPSYMPPSTSKTVSGIEYGSEIEVTSTTAPASRFAWYGGGRKGHRRHNTSSTAVTHQNGRRRADRLGSGKNLDSVSPLPDNPPSEHVDRDDEEDIEAELQPAAAVVRWYRLYNRCSGGYLQLYMNDVNARGKYASPLAQLRVETDSYGSRIRIQSEKFGKYLCFNRRQRITGKYNGRSDRCVFIEKISDNHYTELESAWRPGLYLGFNRGDGKFLDPSRYYTDRRTCFQFIKNSNVSIVDAFNADAFGQQQQHGVGPGDFGRLSPERQRWFRARMRREEDNGVDEWDDAWRHDKDHPQHRLRHENARRRRYHEATNEQ